MATEQSKASSGKWRRSNGSHLLHQSNSQTSFLLLGHDIHNVPLVNSFCVKRRQYVLLSSNLCNIFKMRTVISYYIVVLILKCYNRVYTSICHSAKLTGTNCC